MSANSKTSTSSQTIEVGDIFKIEADEENGITPPLGRLTYHRGQALMIGFWRFVMMVL